MNKALTIALSFPLLLTIIIPPVFLFILALFTSMKYRRYGVYGSLAASLKGKEAKCVTEVHVLEALKKKSFADAVEVFLNTEIGSYLSERIATITTFTDLEENIWNYLSYDIAYIEKYLPEEALLLLKQYLVKYDLANIKQVLRRITEKSIHPTKLVPLGLIYEQGLLKKLDEAASIDEIADIAKIAGLYDYATLIEEYIKKFTTEANIKSVRSELEKKLDSMYYSKLLSLSLKLRGREQLLPCIGTYIDLLNLSIVVRGVLSKDQAGAAKNILDVTYILHHDVLKSMLESRSLDELVEKIERTPYADAGRKIMEIFRLIGDVLLVEKVILDYSMRRIKETVSTVLLTPAVLLHYLLAKEKEIRLVLLTFRVVGEKLPVEVYSKFLKEIR